MADEIDHLRKLGYELTDPNEEGVHRARELLQRRVELASQEASASLDANRRAKGTTLRWRWSVVFASVTLLIGSALGFGVGSAVTPSGNASPSVLGFGFLPVRGWTVVQSRAVTPPSVARAIAANVSLHAEDGLEGIPRGTLASLPPAGIVIQANFTARGDQTRDTKFVASQLPLQLAAATEFDPSSSVRDVSRYRLRAGVGGYNILANVYFGDAAPSAATVEAAQQQLNRLIVASERVTLFVEPRISLSGKPVRVFGSVDSGRAGEDVALQARDCGSQFFRVVGGSVTREGGTWANLYWPKITTTLRAVWNDTTSAEIMVRERAHVSLRRLSATRYSVYAAGRSWRKRVLIQRFDRRLGSWSVARRVVLADSEAGGARARFSLSLPKGTLFRAVYPRSEAGVCYLTGTSISLRA